MYWNKVNNLIKLKENAISVPNFLVFSEFEKINFDYVKDKLTFPLILRSSFDLEDWFFSFAWIFKSYFPIYNEKDFIKYIKKIINYKKDINYIEYIKRNNIDITNTKMNILVQEYIIGDLSWLIFIDNQYINIEIIPWLNELLVSWKTNSSLKIKVSRLDDSYSIESFFLDNKYLTIENNKKIFKQVDYNFLFEEYVILNYLKNLIVISKKINKIFITPQDIEFTINKNWINIVQSRNIVK